MASVDGDPYRTLDSQVPDKERFRDATQFVVRCRECEGSFAFAPIGSEEVWNDHMHTFHVLIPNPTQMPIITPAGVICPGCSEPLGQASIQVQLETQLRQQISNYYAGWTVCEDATCGYRTRAMSVYGKRCLNPGCAARGPVSYEVCRVVLFRRSAKLIFLG